MRGLGRVARAFACALAPAFLAPLPLSAQRSFLEGRVPADVRVQVTHRPYTIRGETVDDIARQLQAGQWAQFNSFYIWNYGQADQGYAFVPGPSGSCRIPDFNVDLRFTVDFPVWEAAAGASAALVEAWDAFHALIVLSFDEYRDATYRMLTEYNRIARRFEADCAILQTELDVMGRRMRQDSDRREQAARERGERARLQWPPPGFEARLAQLSTPTPRGGSFELRPDRSTPLFELPLPDRERLLADAQDEASATGAFGWLIMAGLRHQGEAVYFGDVLNLPPDGGSPIDPESPRPYPGLTELFVSTLAAALDTVGILDLDAPITRYLTEVDPSIGRTTLAHLLTHRSGFDNARPDSARGRDWTSGARMLPSRARFTEPGAIASYSGYDFPLAVHILETVVGRDIGSALAVTLFAPLGMTATSLVASSDGSLPITHTTAADVMRFVSGWVEGNIRGAPPFAMDPASELAPPLGTRTFAWGVWYDEVSGAPRVSLACQAGGFQIFGATRTAFSLWTSSRFPSATWQYLLYEVGEQVGVDGAILRPVDVMGTGTLDTVERTCREPSLFRTVVTRAGEPAPSGTWEGDYRNGDQMMRLGDVGGALQVTNFDPPLDVAHYAGDTYFTARNGQAYFPLRLTTDDAGRRYLVLEGRAFIHLDDAPDGSATRLFN